MPSPGKGSLELEASWSQNERAARALGRQAPPVLAGVVPLRSEISPNLPYCLVAASGLLQKRYNWTYSSNNRHKQSGLSTLMTSSPICRLHRWCECGRGLCGGDSPAQRIVRNQQHRVLATEAMW